MSRGRSDLHKCVKHLGLIILVDVAEVSLAGSDQFLPLPTWVEGTVVSLCVCVCVCVCVRVAKKLVFELNYLKI